MISVYENDFCGGLSRLSGTCVSLESDSVDVAQVCGRVSHSKVTDAFFIVGGRSCTPAVSTTADFARNFTGYKVP